jgi:hypothetical protein
LILHTTEVQGRNMKVVVYLALMLDEMLRNARLCEEETGFS